MVSGRLSTNLVVSGLGTAVRLLLPAGKSGLCQSLCSADRFEELLLGEMPLALALTGMHCTGIPCLPI